MLLWSDLCAGGDRDEEAEKRSLQVQIPNAQKRNQGLFVQIHFASAIQEFCKKHKYKYLMLRIGIKVCSIEIQIQIHYMQVQINAQKQCLISTNITRKTQRPSTLHRLILSPSHLQAMDSGHFLFRF